MKIATMAFFVISALAAAPVASAADMAAADIVNTDGTAIGRATFEQTPSGVLISIEVRGLPPGGHGIHLHAVGSCTPDFKAATGHINPGNLKHGLLNPEGPDNGDLPNLYVAADGSARAEFFTTRVSVAGGDMPALLDEDGSAVIIHENPDDHMTQPIGGAGGRIGCGVVGSATQAVAGSVLPQAMRATTASLAAAPVASSADTVAADIVNTHGAAIGRATFKQAPGGVLISIEASGLPPGGHGIHLHAVGSCTPDFKAATGHINPGNLKHGLRNPEGPDNGDLPNLYVAADGSARAEFFTTRVSVAGGDMPALLDEDGSAVVIHEYPDDHMTQPIGGAGGRIGCGVVGSAIQAVAEGGTAVIESILPQVMRAMTASTVDAVSGRIERATSDTAPAAALNFGGSSTLFGALLANADALGKDTFDLGRLLANSSFALPLDAAGKGGGPFGNLTFWGGGDYRRLSGGSPQSIHYNGSVTSAPSIP